MKKSKIAISIIFVFLSYCFVPAYLVLMVHSGFAAKLNERSELRDAFSRARVNRAYEDQLARKEARRVRNKELGDIAFQAARLGYERDSRLYGSRVAEQISVNRLHNQ